MKLHRRLLLSIVREARREKLSSSVYNLLVAEIFSSIAGYLMLPIAGSIFVGYACWRKNSNQWDAILFVMFVLSAGRLLLAAAYRKDFKRGSTLKCGVTAAYELLFAVLAFGISALLGISIFLFAHSNRPQDVVCALILAMGIAGSISGRNGSRPRIAFAQVSIIIGPLIAAFASGPFALRSVTCSLLIIFIAASYLSITAFYRSLKSSFEDRQKVLSLANRLKRSADLLQIALDNMTTGLLFFDKSRKVLIANKKVRELLGDDLVAKMLGRTTFDFHREVFFDLGMSEEEGVALKSEFGRMMIGKNEEQSLMIDRRRSRMFELRMMPVPEQGAVMSVEDVTDKREKEKEIFRLAHFDHLTGLANRFTFEEALGSHFYKAERSNIAVCYLDLDRFKAINDEYGHFEGDQLLRVIASRINSAKRECDFAARLAGDEFALIFDMSKGRKEVDLVANNIIARISNEIRIKDSIVKMHASAGVVAGSDVSFIPENAVRSADIALYEAKKKGGGIVLWFDEEMGIRTRRLRTLSTHLEVALEKNQMTLVYQPIVDFRLGKMIACEALTRWHHPDFGNISPTEFIPLAEQSGFIHKLGRWALAQACKDLRTWGKDAVKIAVNISALQFYRGRICDEVIEVLADSGADPRLLEVEITESTIAKDPMEMKHTLEKLASLGISIALDDFGTGFSSLSLLHDLPISKIKLDRSFVALIDKYPARARLVSSIVQLAQTLEKQLVIEGIESQQELIVLVQCQARFAQGFYFSKPQTLEDVMSFTPQALSYAVNNLVLDARCVQGR